MPVRTLHPIGIGVVWLGLWAAIAPPPRAQSETVVAINPRDSICYMERADGGVVDLGQLCGGRRVRSTAALSGVDQQFLTDYQAMLQRRFGRLSATQTALSQARQNPQALVQRARAACAQVQSGMSPDLAAIGSGSVDASVISDLALTYYCPDLDN